jgi:hypothetical protein
VLTLPTTRERKKILGFDIENMPLTYYAPDYPTAQITAIASAWAHDPKGTMMVCLLGDEHDYPTMLTHFLDRFIQADIVTGHYIRKHDLPHINAALVEEGFVDGLSSKMTSDTKMDLVSWKGLPKNQEYLAHLMGVKAQKVPMTQADWREANRFTKAGLARTKKRVVQDVLGQLQMRDELIARNLLKEPRLWRP